MNQYQAILIGNGTMGQRHRARFEAVGTRFVKILDKDAVTWLKECFDQWSKVGEGSSEKGENILEENRLDFAVVASPASTHYEYVKFFLERKIPVLVEKPLATTSEQAKELQELALANDVLLFVAQSECYNPLFLNFRKHMMEDLRNAIAASRSACGGTSHPLTVKMDFCREHGFSERCRDVDVSLDLLIHDVSLFLNMFESKDVIVENNRFFPNRHDELSSGSNNDCARLKLKVVSGEFAGVEAVFFANRNSKRDLRTIGVEFGKNGPISGFNYTVSLAHYTSEGNVVHIPNSLDNEHKFFFKLLSGSLDGWWHRALANAVQSVCFVSKSTMGHGID